MTATAFLPTSPRQMYSNTSHRVENVVQTTEHVRNFYAQAAITERESSFKVHINSTRIFDETFINNLTKEIKDLCKLAQEIFLNNEPFTPKTYRDAREAHEDLSKSIEVLRDLSETKLDLTVIPLEIHVLVKAIREFFIILNKCQRHLSVRFDELDKPNLAVKPSKYLRRVTGKERWDLRPNAYEYQV